MPVTSWFAGHLLPGDKSSAIFTIENPSNEEIKVKIISQKLSLIKKDQYHGETKVRQKDLNYLKDPDLKEKDYFIPNYIQLSDAKLHKTLGDFYDDKNPIPEDSSLMIWNWYLPWDNFMNKTDETDEEVEEAEPEILRKKPKKAKT